MVRGTADARKRTAAADRLRARGRRGGGRPARPAELPAEVLNMLDAYALVQAAGALQLSEEQYGDVRHAAEAAAGDPPPQPAGRATASSRSCGSWPGHRQPQAARDDNAIRQQLKALARARRPRRGRAPQGLRCARRSARRQAAGALPAVRGAPRAAQDRPADAGPAGCRAAAEP